MSSIKVEDDILLPLESLRVNYKGSNPFNACKAFPTILKDIMKVSSSSIGETELKWDTTGPSADFYGKWIARRSEDRWTKTFIRIIAQGDQSKDYKGSIKIIIKGTVATEYEFSNFIQKSFWWFFNLGFYYNQRRKYLEYARENVEDIKISIQKVLNVYSDE